jgi:hypothetical protein
MRVYIPVVWRLCELAVCCCALLVLPGCAVLTATHSSASQSTVASQPVPATQTATSRPSPATSTLPAAASSGPDERNQPAQHRQPHANAAVHRAPEPPAAAPDTLWIPAEGEQFIALDTSKTTSPPEDAAGDPERMKAWIEQEGIDAGWQQNHQGGALVLFGGAMRVLDGKQWDTVTAGAIAEAMADAPLVDHDQVIPCDMDKLPVAFLVKTREGGMGIVRVCRSHGRLFQVPVEIQYKMLVMPEQPVADLSSEQMAGKLTALRKEQARLSAELLRAKVMLDAEDPRIVKGTSSYRAVTRQIEALEAEHKARVAASQPADAHAAAAESQPAVNLRFEDFPSRFADGNCLQGLPRPEVLTGQKKPAFCKSDRPLLFDMHHSPMPTKILLDESGGTCAGYDTLYLDFNDNGDFLDDPVYKPTLCLDTMFPGAEPVVLYFRDVHVPRNLQQGRSAHVQIFIERLPGWPQDITSLHPRFIPQRWAVGTVALDGRQVPAALIDRNWDDTFTDKRGLDVNRTPPDLPRGDYLVLGLDGEEGLLPCDLDEYAGSARVVLNEYLAVNDRAYQVKADKQAQGIHLELVPTSLPMGTLNLDPAPKVGRLVLIGTKTTAIIQSPGGQVRVPADTYFVPQLGSRLYTVGRSPPSP